METERPGRLSSARPLPAPAAAPLLAVLAGSAVGVPSLVGVISHAVPDRAIVLAVLATGAPAGLLPAVGLGVAIAAGLFLLTYARRDSVRSRPTGAERRSTTEPGAGGPLVVARFLPGAVVGAIGFYAGTPRTATVRAGTGCTIRRIGAAAVARLSAADPGRAPALHRMIGAMLAGRLARKTRLLRQLD